jgi:hypothetical protein
MVKPKNKNSRYKAKKDKTHKRYKKQKNNYNKTYKKKENKKNNQFQKVKCAPNPNKNEVLGFTCYTSEALEKMRQLWNARHPDYKIQDNDPRQVWEELKENMEGTCNNELCWIKQNFVKNNLDSEILNYTFAPKAPSSWLKNPNEWLSSMDILNVMKQYEKRFHCFDFLGPSPIDFDDHVMFGECVWEELCKFNLNNFLKNEKYKIGVIFNLDPHYKNGSHWVALFINIRKKQILYFDSYGTQPCIEIKRFIKKIIKQAQHLNINIKYTYNKTRHQYGNSECGMYSLHFIIENLKDTPLKELMDKKISDEEMVQLRKSYFNL